MFKSRCFIDLRLRGNYPMANTWTYSNMEKSGAIRYIKIEKHRAKVCWRHTERTIPLIILLHEAKYLEIETNVYSKTEMFKRYVCMFVQDVFVSP